MANNLYTALRYSSLLLRKLPRSSNVPVICAQVVRNLYSKQSLGLDAFMAQKERTERQMLNIADKFREKMQEYSSDESKNMIFTEDLKNMIHLSNDDKDVELVIKMLKRCLDKTSLLHLSVFSGMGQVHYVIDFRYNQQNKQLRFGTFIFGPVVMRMFYILNKPDLALECFKSPELSGLFDHASSYLILMDLLLINDKYKEVLETSQIVKERQLDGIKYQKHVVTLTFAACYKMNSQESLEYAIKLWKDLQAVGHLPMRKATTFFAGLALNQGKPNITLETVTLVRNQNYITIRNLKVAALIELGRIVETLPILRSILERDTPTDKLHTFNKDVIEKVKSAVEKQDNEAITLEFNRILELFQKQGHVTNSTLDEQLCSELENRPQHTFARPENTVRKFRRFQNKPQESYSAVSHRPGLSELV